LDYLLKRLFKATVIAVMCTLPVQLLAASKASARFDLIGHISQKSGQSEVGVVLLKDTESKKTLVVQIGKGFKLGSIIYHVVSLTDRGAIISDGSALLHIGDAYTKTDSQPQTIPPIMAASSSKIPKKFRISNRPMNAFKKARLISPAKRGSIQARLETQEKIVENAEQIRENDWDLAPDDENLIEQNYDETGFGTVSNN